MSKTVKITDDAKFNYRNREGLYDEVLTASGETRPAWRYVFGALDSLGTTELGQRQQKALRILRDDGATYNVYNSNRPDQTWPLDLIPWVIDSGEWNQIEAGLQERAELFNLILKDIYGERELITRGILPPEVVFGHKGFLRACDAIALPGEHQLINHAVDMMRLPDGSMCVLTDRTQAPSGAGYALENRTVMSRVLPSLYRDSQVHRLANFFQNMRHRLIELAPGVATPRIVVLTPGAHNETYFEHSYLANYLGFTLVQSGDLVVRNGYVWMKSLDGLARVDVILRRVDDYYCDQVELKGDSQLGVAGLLQVVRAGRVAIANPLGSGVLESPALLRYLPAISSHFLGRTPRLNSVPTWWCGDRDDYQYVFEHFDQLIIKPVFRSPGAHSRVVSTLCEEDRDQLAEAIRMRPHQFVAQEKLSPSHIPIFDGFGAAPRPVILRSYAVAADTSYRVMPGGLTRVGATEDSELITLQVGALSKDTWVLASEPEKAVDAPPRLSPGLPGDLGAAALPSRVVENLFWMGRYAERAENGLRLMRTVFLQTNAANPIPEGARQLLLQSVTRLTATYPGFVADDLGVESSEAELVSVIVDRERLGSISSCIHAMLASAEESKELLSADTQRIVNDIRDQMLYLEESLQSNLVSAPEEALDPLVSSLLALSGIVQESMMRGIGWRFTDMGRRLERAIQTINLTRAIMVNPLEEAEETVLLESLLLTIEALISYRRRYRSGLNIRDVLELILIDSSNPRSVLYQLEKLDSHLSGLPATLSHSRELEEEARCILEALSRVRLCQLAELASIDEVSQARAELDQFFGRLLYLLNQASNVLGSKFFDHTLGPQQLVRQNWGME